MVFVRRSADGSIASISLEPDALHGEALDGADPEVTGFVRALGGDESLAGSDLALVRVIEDLVDLLIARDLVRFTDLPDAAQEKLMRRRSMRASKRALDLLSGGGEIL